ncbi:MAG: sn-glycerol-3-phosphate ABC transporter ATP-binding protein UgpC [Salinisphaera sp.]|jgi:multiple sugar transport system ATP-binding protein|nr:sn-glycerol-3-phosphate ABC transporter ATP-binding protein UgpC [Salinisphaera sp.]
MTDLTLRRVIKRYGDEQVVHGIDLDIREREFVVFVGPSGCGKSTLLRMIAGLEPISGGDVHIGDTRVNDVPAGKRGVAMVFQNYALYPHMTVRENMSFGLRNVNTPKTEIRQRVDEAAAILRIEPLLERRPKDMSGGQRQRVAIGRAIVRKPKVFLFDEPLSNLDAKLRVQMRIELARLHRQLKATMIYVTHDQVEAMTLADRMVVLRDGRIEQSGPPADLYESPCNLFVAGFLGSPSMNFLPATVTDHDADGVWVDLAAGGRLHVPRDGSGLSPGETVTVGLRPEHVRPADEGTLAGSLEVVEHLGDQTLLHIRLGEDSVVIARDEGRSAHTAGENIQLAFSGSTCHLFDGDGNACPILSRDAAIT